MAQHIGALALLVADYDQAITFFTQGLGFELLEDTPSTSRANRASAGCGLPQGGPGFRPVAGAGRDPGAAGRHRSAGGGRVFLFLETDDFWGDYQRMQAYGVHFCEQPRLEAYGTVVVFEDISGNRWDLLQLAAAN